MWARTWGGPGGVSYRDTSQAVIADSFGNVFVSGYFYFTADFDPGSGVDNHTATSTRDIFLIKFDAAGNYLWGHSIGGTGYEEAYELSTDHFGDVYMAGEFTYTIDFDPGPGTEQRTSSPTYYNDVYLVKYNTNGGFQWVNAWGGDRYYDEITGLVVDTTGNIIASGYYSSYSPTDFDPGPGTDMKPATGSNSSFTDAFVVKYAMNGDYQWGNTWGASEEDTAEGVGVDSVGDIYIAGTYKWNVDFDPGSGVEQPGYFWDKDCYMSKFNPAGTFQWVKIWGGVSGDDYVRDMSADSSGNCFIQFYIYNSVDIDPGPGTDNRSGGTYLSRFNSNGLYQWGHYMSISSCYDMCNDSDGNLLFAGYFSYNQDFDPGPGTDNHSSNGQSDAFVWKLMPDGYY